MCVNMNGLREKRKRILLGKPMRNLWAGICVVTETHLRKSDLNQLAYDNYHVIANYCRPIPLGGRIGWGVVILDHGSLSVEVGKKLDELAPQVEHCEVKPYLRSNETQIIRISGIYIPPAAAAIWKHERLRTTLAPAPEDDPAATPSLILAGDFNVASWEANYAEWLHDEGVTEMTNP